MRQKLTVFSIFQIFLFLTLAGQAQVTKDDPNLSQIKSLISKNKEVTGFGSFDFKVSQALDNQVLLIGVHGGVLTNKKVMLGVAGYGLTTKFDIKDKLNSPDPQTLNLHGGYAGFLMGYKLAPKEIIHLSFPLIVGAGQMEISDPNYFQQGGNNIGYTIEKSGFVVVEPGMQIELNLSKNFRLGLGATYHLTRGLSLENLSDDQMTGFMGMVSFQVGKF